MKSNNPQTKTMEMIRIYKHHLDVGEEVWIPEGTFNVYRKKYEKLGYYVKQSIVRKEITLWVK